MKNPILKHSFYTLLSLLPLIYLALIWNTIPKTIPTHFSIHGPNHYGDKSMLLMSVVLIAVVTIFCYFLMQFISKVDPKRSGKPTAPVFNKLAIGITLFLLVINFMTILACAKGYQLTKAVLCLVGLLFAFMGNVMHNIKPNYFAGIRIPWTLNSDFNWRKTHQLAGKIWFIAGLCFTIVGLTLPQYMTSLNIRLFVGIMVVVPIAYSFILYRKEKSNPDITNTNN